MGKRRYRVLRVGEDPPVFIHEFSTWKACYLEFFWGWERRYTGVLRIRGSFLNSDDIGFPKEMRVDMIEDLLKRRRASAASGDARDIHWQDRYPAIHAYLTASRVGDKPRLTATLTLMTGDGIFRVVLNDRETQQSLWGCGDGVEQSLNDLEQRLNDENATWRDSDSGKRKKK